MNIGKKLFLAFSITNLSVLAVGGVGVWALLQNKAMSEQRLATSVKALTLLAPMGNDVSQMVGSVQSVLLQGAGALDGGQMQIAELKGHFDSQLRAYDATETGAEAQNQYHALLEKYAPFRALIDHVLFVVGNGSMNDAAAVLAEGNSAIRELQSEMTDFLGFNQAMANAAIEDTQAVADQSVFVVVVLTVVAFTLAVWLSASLTRSLALPLRGASRLAAQVSEGDLTVRFDSKAARRKDEVGQLAQSLDALAVNLTEHVETIRRTGTTIAQSAEKLDARATEFTAVGARIDQAAGDGGRLATLQTEGVNQSTQAIQSILKTIEELDVMVGEQAASVAQTTAALEQSASNTASIVTFTERMAAVFSDLRARSSEGRERLFGTLEKVKVMAAQSEHLENANATIRGIASQTSLLSMNAAIEAAHAGDAGRGFSVVADEIGKLSESAAAQSQEIGSEIETLETLIAEVSEEAGRSQAVFDTILDQIEALGAVQTQIRSAMAEQELGNREILKATGQVNAVTSAVRTGSARILDDSRGIASEMERIHKSAVQLQQGIDVILAETQALSRSVTAIQEDSGHHRILAEELESAVGVFRLN